MRHRPSLAIALAVFASTSLAEAEAEAAAPGTDSSARPVRPRPPKPTSRGESAEELADRVNMATAGIAEDIAALRREIAELKAAQEAFLGPAPKFTPPKPTPEQWARRADLTQEREEVETKLQSLDAVVASGAVDRDAVAASFEVLQTRLAAILAEIDKLDQAAIVPAPRPMLLQRLDTIESRVSTLAVPPPTSPEPTPVPPAPSPSPTSSAPAVTWDGLLDTYGLWNMAASPATSGQKFRAFDTSSGGFALNYVKLGGQLEAERVTLRIDVGYGHLGAISNQASAVASGTSSGNSLTTALYNSAFLVQQAFAQVKLGSTVLDAGKFLTSAGAEVIETHKNWLYSRSLLFGGQPLVHTGLRLTVNLSKLLAVQASLTNGMNNDPAPHGDKTFGLAMTYLPAPKTSVAAAIYVGRYAVYSNVVPPPGDVQVLVDLVFAHNISEALAVNLNVDYYGFGSESWYGAAASARLALAPNLAVAGRGELLRSNKAYATELGDGGYLGEGTLMIAIPIDGNYELRLETRVDMASRSVFSPKSAEQSRAQVTALAGFLAFF